MQVKKHDTRQWLRASTILLALLVSAFKIQAQLVTSPMTGTPTPGTYYNPTSISVVPNFSFTASNGNSLVLKIMQPDCITLSNGLSTNRNFILTSVPRSPGYVPSAINSNPSNYTSCDIMQTVEYLDGLGRPAQTIQIKGSTNGNDVVQPFAYDQYGREALKYLPYANTNGTNDGSFKTAAATDQLSFYNPSGSMGTQQSNGIARITTPYAPTAFEPSPLDRAVEQGAPGDPWQLAGTTGLNATPGNTVKTTYGTNAGEVLSWTVNSGGNGATSTTYNAGELYKTVVSDENQNNTITYKDLIGHTVCRMVQNGSNYLTTYYVYDDYGNLAYVIPPTPTATTSFLETDNVFVNFIYGYHYDQRNRMSEKHIPGKGWTFMVYNTLDQVIFTQDAFQRSQNNQVWEYIKYDPQGRQVMTGLWTAGVGIPGYAGDSNAASPSEALHNWLINWANLYNPLWITRDNSQQYGYSVSDPQGPILTINYYDDYGFPGGSTYAPSTSLGITTNTTGLLTGTKVTAMGTIFNTNPDMLMTISYYDALGHNIQTFKQHYLNSTLSASNYDAIVTSYNFNNQVTGVTRQHYNTTNTAAPVLTVANIYTYDHMGRKLQTQEQINGGNNIVLSQLDYNEIGQVMTKHLHSNSIASPNFLQDIGYTYNERGWLKGSNAALFAMQLNYNDGTTPQWNGNITNQLWGAAGNLNNSYTYNYDPLNRLTDGVSSQGYTEDQIQYDNLGNITSLRRQGVTYGYSYASGSQLSTVSGITVAPYQYNLNGSVAYDGRLNKLVTYNLLGSLQSLASDGFNLSYNYDAYGNKLNKTYNGASTDYIDGIQYNYNTGSTPTISFVRTEEGRALNLTGTPNYEYNLSDHLGNSRQTFDTSLGYARAVQHDDYYPFGMDINSSTDSPPNNYLYNKKELQQELGQYDYGARFYDPVIARWASIDPMAEKMTRYSPYSYGFDNSIRFEDPDGMVPCNPCTTGHDPNSPTQFVRTGDVLVAQKELKEVKITPEVYGSAATATAYDGKADANLFNTGASLKASYGSFSFNVTGYDAEAHATAEDGLGASASMLKGAVNAKLGTDDYNIHGGATGKLLSANANVNAEGSTHNGVTSVGVSATAGAYVAHGDFTGGFNIKGFGVNYKGGGDVASAHIGAEFGIKLNSNTHSMSINYGENIGLGIGEDFHVKIDIPIPWLK